MCKVFHMCDPSIECLTSLSQYIHAVTLTRMTRDVLYERLDDEVRPHRTFYIDSFRRCLACMSCESQRFINKSRHYVKFR